MITIHTLAQQMTCLAPLAVSPAGCLAMQEFRARQLRAMKENRGAVVRKGV